MALLRNVHFFETGRYEFSFVVQGTLKEASQRIEILEEKFINSFTLKEIALMLTIDEQWIRNLVVNITLNTRI